MYAVFVHQTVRESIFINSHLYGVPSAKRVLSYGRAGLSPLYSILLDSTPLFGSISELQITAART